MLKSIKGGFLVKTTKTTLSAEYTQYLSLYSDHISLDNREDKISFIEQWLRLQCWIDSELDLREYPEDDLPLKNDIDHLSSDDNSGLDNEFVALSKCLDPHSDMPFVWHIFRAVNKGDLPETFEHFLVYWLEKQELPCFPFAEEENIDSIGFNTEATSSMVIEYALQNPEESLVIQHIERSLRLRNKLGFYTKEPCPYSSFHFGEDPPIERHVKLWWNVCLSMYPDVNSVITALDAAKSKLHSEELEKQKRKEEYEAEGCLYSSTDRPVPYRLFTSFFPGEQHEFAELYNSAEENNTIGVLLAWLIHGAGDLGYQIKSLASSVKKAKHDLSILLAQSHDELCNSRTVYSNDQKALKDTVIDLLPDILPLLKEDKSNWLTSYIQGDEEICQVIINHSEELISPEVFSALLIASHTNKAQEHAWKLLSTFEVSSPALLGWLAETWDKLPVKLLSKSERGKTLLRSSYLLSDRLTAIAELLGDITAPTTEEHDPNKLNLNALTALDWESFRDQIHRWVVINAFAILDEADSITEKLITDASQAVWNNMGKSGEHEFTAKRIRAEFNDIHKACDAIFPSRSALKSVISKFVDDPEQVVRILDQSSDEVLPALLRNLLYELCHRDSMVEQDSLCLRIIKAAHPDYPQVWTRQIATCLDKHAKTMSHQWIRSFCLCLGFLREPWGNKVPKMLATIGSNESLSEEIREVAKQQRQLFNRENLPKGQGRSPKRRVEDVKSCLILTASKLGK
jgi:hypothetical protein